MDLKIVEGDLLDQEVEVIVNPWNRNIIPWWLLLPQGVSGAIKKRGGLGPFRELAKKGPIPLGGAVETSSGQLPYKAIIHVAGINFFWVSTEKSITDSIHSAMEIVKAKGYSSLAFPLIGAGTGGSNQEVVLKLIRDTLSTIQYDGHVRIVVRELRVRLQDKAAYDLKILEGKG
ncbi:MAG: macro domain-containing protein [Proteobacteria bacterium]|nr:macro domain-containing protein [Pseudomonadota bacterium]